MSASTLSGSPAWSFAVNSSTSSARLSLNDSCCLTTAAEQFMALVLSVPQRRGLGLGSPLDTVGQEVWAKRAVDLFLQGLPVGDGRGQRPMTPDLPSQSYA